MAPRSEDSKIIIRVINFELVQPIYAHGTSTLQTDGRTDVHRAVKSIPWVPGDPGVPRFPCLPGDPIGPGTPVAPVEP